MLVTDSGKSLISLTYEDPGARQEAHADWLYSTVNTYGKAVDIVFESKMKELAVLRLRGNRFTARP
ncbi:hypothetical protein ACFPMF_09305 [Larkinella bovis]|uniref:Uncharacterized protein n=1 Tax=Larkinella bovis TaxID=683041 RepID=A0ABW0IAE1_9BACT